MDVEKWVAEFILEYDDDNIVGDKGSTKWRLNAFKMIICMSTMSS